MKIKNGSFNIVFPHVHCMRENLFNLERVFSNFMVPFNLMPIPNEAPPEIPRILASSKNGHSQLMISGNNVQVTTNFDSRFWYDIDACFKYMENMRNKILESLAHLGLEQQGHPSFYYSGLTMNVEYSQEDGILDPVEFIANKFLKSSIPATKRDLAFRTTITIEDTYFVNIEVSNNRILEGMPVLPGSLYGTKEVSHTLAVTVDINDRLAFNTKAAYISSKETATNIFNLSYKYISEALPTLIKDGDIRHV